jgi:hypothetical protein
MCCLVVFDLNEITSLKKKKKKRKEPSSNSVDAQTFYPQ